MLLVRPELIAAYLQCLEAELARLLRFIPSLCLFVYMTVVCSGKLKLREKWVPFYFDNMEEDETMVKNLKQEQLAKKKSE